MILCNSGVNLGSLWEHSGATWHDLGTTCCNLGTTWCNLGATWRHLSATWRHLGATWRHLGVTFGIWGWRSVTLGLLWHTMEALWDHFRIIFKSLWGHFGIILGSLCAPWDHFGGILNIWALLLNHTGPFSKNTHFPPTILMILCNCRVNFGTTLAVKLSLHLHFHALWGHFGSLRDHFGVALGPNPGPIRFLAAPCAKVIWIAEPFAFPRNPGHAAPQRNSGLAKSIFYQFVNPFD